MSDNQYELSEKYYEGLEAIVREAQRSSDKDRCDDLMDASASHLCNQVVVPFNNCLDYIFRNHICFVIDDEELLGKMSPFFQTIIPIDTLQYKWHETPKKVGVSHFGLSSVITGITKRWDDEDHCKSDENEKEVPEGYYEEVRESLRRKLSFDTRLYYKIIDALEQREIQILESLLVDPESQEIVQKSWEKHLDEEEIDRLPFQLPKDFFKEDFKEEAPQEHFYLNKRIKARGDDAFQKFINYLSDHDYISSDEKVKLLFVYRMTGRCRPEGELPIIQWNGKNGKSYELIYIIRYFSERGDYRKMKRFFTGPEWVKDRDSSYAQSADTELRSFLWKLYPGVCV